MIQESLHIVASEDTPSVSFEVDSGMLEIGERSLPEDAAEFFRPALLWLDSYLKHPADETVLNIKLEYYNTTSAKQLFRILTMLEDINDNHHVLVRWYYTIGDEDMRFAGERFARLVDLSFEIIEVTTLD